MLSVLPRPAFLRNHTSVSWRTRCACEPGLGNSASEHQIHQPPWAEPLVTSCLHWWEERPDLNSRTKREARMVWSVSPSACLCDLGNIALSFRLARCRRESLFAKVLQDLQREDQPLANICWSFRLCWSYLIVPPGFLREFGSLGNLRIYLLSFRLSPEPHVTHYLERG